MQRRHRICLGFVYRQGGVTWINGHTIRPSDLQVYAAGSEIDYRAGPDTAWIGTQLAVSLLQETAGRHLGRPLALSTTETRNFAPHPRIFERFAGIVRSTIGEFRSGRVDAACARDTLATAGVEAIAAGEDREVKRSAERSLYRWQIIRRADEYLRGHLAHGYDSSRLCHALGMSERNLQIHFRLALGLSPKAWHQRLALHAVRRRLREESRWRISVTDAALQEGFRHLGRFAAAYRDLFGETPSETRRKR